MRDVVEHQPRNREHLEVVVARRERPAAPLEDGVLRVERERHEGQEPARLVLQLAQPHEVIDPLLVGLDVVVEHRAVRRQADRVRDPVRLDPDVGVLFARRDDLAHAVGEHLGAAARKRAEPDRLELLEHLEVREPREPRHVVDLARRKALQVHIGKRGLERADQVEVVVEVEVRRLAADHVDLLVAVAPVHLDGVLDEITDVPGVRTALLVRAREGAELALHAAHVRVVEVEVVDEVDLVVALLHAPRGVREIADGQQVV